MQGASVRGEGKLHLGYVYANERDRLTAPVMLDGAFSFSRLLDRWLPEPLLWDELRSEPFLYAVLPGTMVGADMLAQHYAWVDEQISTRIAAGATYAGTVEMAPVRPLAAPEDHGLSGEVPAAYTTSEVAVDPALLARGLVSALAQVSVAFHGGTTVRSVERAPQGFTVTAARGVGADAHDVTLRADVVINCLWDGRLAVDATLDISPPRPWLYRLKYAVHGSMPPGAPPPPSVTMVLGPFGDIVRRAGGRIYASWYPVCHTASSQDLIPPTSWAGPMAGTDPAGVAADLAVSTVKGLAEHAPALDGLRVDAVAAGVIVAWGATDIDQIDSELHHRHAIGVHEHDGYLSVDTGKLTTAPLFAQRVAEALGAAPNP
jgi:hypothetical protein